MQSVRFVLVRARRNIALRKRLFPLHVDGCTMPSWTVEIIFGVRLKRAAGARFECARMKAAYRSTETEAIHQRQWHYQHLYRVARGPRQEVLPRETKALSVYAIHRTVPLIFHRTCMTTEISFSTHVYE